MSLPWDRVQLFKRRFREDLFDVTLWDRNKYYPEYYKNADSVVFLLPDFSFQYEIGDLPIGVRRELNEAIREGKKIYLGYITASGDYKIYNASADNYAVMIKGIPGSGDLIFSEKPLPKFVSPGVPTREGIQDFYIQRDSSNYTLKGSTGMLESDRRLLLLM
jgi:hypothetical protein